MIKLAVGKVGAAWLFALTNDGMNDGGYGTE
jgi:hypothetical protein